MPRWSRCEVDPARALHVGDQPKSDIVGARGVGMSAVLLDRYDRHNDAEIPTVNSLTELAEKVVAGQVPRLTTTGA